MPKEYFDLENYKGRHFHVDNFEPFWVEAIAWERIDGSWDVMFYDSESKEEFNILFGSKSYYIDEVGGVFLFNADTDEQCTEKFAEWVQSNLAPIRRLK